MTTVFVAGFPFYVRTRPRNLPAATTRSAADSPPAERAGGGSP